MNSSLPLEAHNKLIDYLGFKLFDLEDTYLVLRELSLHYNRAAAGEAANEYLKVVNSNKGFFVPVIKALEFKLLVGIHSYLGKKDDRSLGKAINKLQAEKAGMNLVSEYNALVEKHKKLLDSVKIMRHKRLAHDENIEIDEVETRSSDKQFMDLFEDTKNLLNKVQGHFENYIWFMDEDARESIKDTHDMMNNLLRGEAQRIGEINVEYNHELFKSGRIKWLKST